MERDEKTGKWVKDPIFDEEYDQIKENAEKMAQVLQETDAEHRAKAEFALDQEMRKKAMEESGITIEDINELGYGSHEDLKEMIYAGRKAQVDLLARKKAGRGKAQRDTRTGQFAPSRPAAAREPQPQSSEKIEAAKEVIKKRPLSSEEELSILESVLKG